MNKVTIEVEQIRSYQTLVKQANNRRFRTKYYNNYIKELEPLRELSPISDNKPIRAVITYNVKESIEPTQFVVKMLKTHNTSKVFYTLDEAEAYADRSKHYIEIRKEIVRYGNVGDMDNITKPILDTLQEYGVISDDRFITELDLQKTFGNERNTIEVELIEL